MSRGAPYGRSSSQSRERARFEDAFRVYHEVEDVGKTVKASKRRARWTFSFGAQGQEHEVILVHSVMSGKKTVTYDGRTVHHAEEMARAFSYSWRDGDHVLRVDISDLVDYGTGRGGDRMYELTLDGVPFGSLPTKPVTLPPRPAVRVSGGSRASLSDSQRRRSGDGGGSGIGGSASLLGDDGHDDFDPRGTGNGKPRAVGMRPSAGGAGGNDNTVDLLGGPPSTDGFAVAAAPPAVPTGGFAPFSAGAATAGGGGGGFPVAFGGPPAAAVVDTKRLADEFGGLALATPAVPTVSSPLVAQKAPGAGGGGNGYYGGGPTKVPLPDMSTFKQPENAGLPSPGEDGAITTTSTALIAVGDAQTPPDVARLTAAIVNLNNLERESDGTKSPPRGNIYRSVYADHRSLAEMQASQAGKPQAPPAKPIFIDRPVPSPRGVPPMMMGQQQPMMQQQQQQQQQQQMMMMMPLQAAFYGQHPGPGGPPPMGVGMGMGMQQQGMQQQPPPMMMMGGGGMGMGMGMQQQQQQQQYYPQQGRPPMMMMGGGAPMGMGMIPPPPQQPQQQGGMVMGMGGGPGAGMGMGMMGGPQMQMQQQMQQQGASMPPRGMPPNKDPFFGL